MSRVVTFGEIMMRLNPPGYLRLLQTPIFEISFAGVRLTSQSPSPTSDWMYRL